MDAFHSKENGTGEPNARDSCNEQESVLTPITELSDVAFSPSSSRQSERLSSGILREDKVIHRIVAEQGGALLGISPNGMFAAFFTPDEKSPIFNVDFVPKGDARRGMPEFLQDGMLLQFESRSSIAGTIKIYSLAEESDGEETHLVRSFPMNVPNATVSFGVLPLSDGKRLLLTNLDIMAPRKLLWDLRCSQFSLCEFTDDEVETGIREIRSFRSKIYSPRVVFNADESEVFLHGNSLPSLLQTLSSFRRKHEGVLHKQLDQISLDPKAHYQRVLIDRWCGSGPKDPAHSPAIVLGHDNSYILSGCVGGVEFTPLTGDVKRKGGLIQEIDVPPDARIRSMAINESGERLAIAFARVGGDPEDYSVIQMYKIVPERGGVRFERDREFQSKRYGSGDFLSFLPGTNSLVLGSFSETLIFLTENCDTSHQSILGSSKKPDGLVNGEGNVVAKNESELLVFRTSGRPQRGH